MGLIRQLDLTFTYACVVSDSHVYGVNAALMFMSKGGIQLSDCDRMGPITKDRYLTVFQEIWKNAYGSDRKSSEGMSLEAGSAGDSSG